MKVGQFEDTRLSYCWNSLVLRSVAGCAKKKENDIGARNSRWWKIKFGYLDIGIGIGIGILGIWILIFWYCYRYWCIGYLDI